MQVLDQRAGDVVTLRTVEHPTGGTPAELECQLMRKESDDPMMSQ